jgi:membrane-associated phospholipid phosphatase
MNQLHNLDVLITKGIFNFFNQNHIIHKIPYWAGFIPFKYYVEPGLYFALMQIIWLYTYEPLQFHIIPHLIITIVFNILYKVFKRSRPGCTHKSMTGHMHKSFCSTAKKHMSFPSRNTAVAFTLLAIFYSEMMFSNNPKFFSFSIKEKYNRDLIVSFGTIASVAVGLHDIAKGYHHFSDVLVGALVGASVGAITWQILDIFDKKFDACENDEIKNSYLCHETNKVKLKFLTNEKKYLWIEIIIKCILSIIVFGFFLSFLIKAWTAKDNKYEI